MRTELRFGAASLPLDERGAALADDCAAMLAAGGGRIGQNRGADAGVVGVAGGEAAGDGLERTLATLVGTLHARSWDHARNRLQDRSGGRPDGPCASKGTAPTDTGESIPPRTHRICTDRTAVPRADRTVGDFRIRRALRLMREAVAMGEEVDLDRTAREAGLSRPHFFKLFRAHVGVTPGTFVNALKMEASYERLSVGRDTVTAIGLDLGFASQASFTRFFIAQSGIAPSDYRQAVAAMRTVGARTRVGNETVGYA